MKNSLFILAFICVLFASCNKVDEETDAKEDLSYLIQTYNRQSDGNTIKKTTRSFDGYKETGYQYYVNGQLYQENKNYSYNGLNASWDSYSYRNGDANDVTVQHVECEYLDNTFLRIKNRRTTNLQNNHVSESYYEYDGKKIVSIKNYSGGVLTSENHDYIYDGLYCTYKETIYNYRERDFIIEYLDNTYLREKTRMYTMRYLNGNTDSHTLTTFYHYDHNTKPIGYHCYINDKLAEVARDYQYDGLKCYYSIEAYNVDGEVISTWSYEIEYLE